MNDTLQRPYGLIAELTYRCPLRCPYCSNPVGGNKTVETLTAGEWGRVIDEAAAIGALHVLFTGGEPLLRPELESFIAQAHGRSLFTNLITSGVGLSEKRAESLRNAGLDSVQISFQAAEQTLNDEIAHSKTFTKKRAAVNFVKAVGLPLTINVVLHRRNIDHLSAIIDMLTSIRPDRIELAHTQFYGWGFKNRADLLPTQQQIARANELVSKRRSEFEGTEFIYVLPDYFSRRPKRCIHGWGQRSITVNPDGFALPCPSASSIKTLTFPNIRTASLKDIWDSSEAFNAFRGTSWMKEPCRSCPLKERDLGGCRCQAALISGDAALADPVCEHSPHRGRIDEFIMSALPAS